MGLLPGGDPKNIYLARLGFEYSESLTVQGHETAEQAARSYLLCTDLYSQRITSIK